MKIILIRSPLELVMDGMAGYGWKYIDFSSYESLDELMKSASAKGMNFGRKIKQVARFYNATEGDIVVAPAKRSIYLGIVTQGKSFNADGGYGANRINVRYFQNKDGKPLRIPRTELSQGLQSRLKIRMSNTYLNEFSDEINSHIKKIKAGKSVRSDIEYLEHEEALIETFKEQLLKKIRNGSTNLEGGGYGLEKLVKELMEIEGYEANIEAKNKTSDISDVDVIATRTDRFSSNRVFIQVKHHNGFTNDMGIKQLIEIEDDEHVDKWLITSGKVLKAVQEQADAADISVMEGDKLVEWIYECLDKLSNKTKQSLRIGILPQVVY